LRLTLSLSLSLYAACSYDFDRYAAPGDPVEAAGGDGGVVSEGGTSAGEATRGGAAGSGGKGGAAGASGKGGAAGIGGGSGGAGKAGAGSGGVSEAGEAGTESTTAGAGAAGAGGAVSSFDCDAVNGTTFDTHCYFAIGGESGLPFEDASATCAASDGAHLVAIGSAEEQAALVSTFFPGSVDYWIGLSLESAPSDPPDECSFLPVLCPFDWVTNEPLEFTNWAPRAGDEEPNYSGACVRMQASDQTWADVGCTTALPAICEHE
jgi:hypothetical protein